MLFLKELTILDWIILTILMGSIVSSFLKGFVREAISLGSAVVGLLIASWFYSTAGALVAPYVKTQDVASLVGFAMIFFGVLFLGAGVSFLVNRFLEVVQLKGFDRLLGAAFGFARGWVVGSVLFMILTAFPVQIENVQDAKLAPYLLASARVLVLATPASLKAKFRDGYQKVQEFWKRDMIPQAATSDPSSSAFALV